MAAVQAEDRRRAALGRLAEAGALPRADWSAVEAEVAARGRWRRRVLVALLWLAVVYPVAAGPTAYVIERGWLPRWAWDVYEPLAAVSRGSRPDLFELYVDVFRGLGRRQAGW